MNMKLTLLRVNKKIEVDRSKILRIFKSPYGTGTVLTFHGGYYLVKESEKILRQKGFMK